MPRDRLTIVWMVALALVMAAEMAAHSFPHHGRSSPLEQLLEYQISKARTLPENAVIFLGDSSLGNAIDAQTASKALGRPVVNLALAAPVGMTGDLFMLRETLSARAPAAVVMQHIPNGWAGAGKPTALAILRRRARGDSDPFPERLASKLALARGAEGFKAAFCVLRRGIVRPATPGVALSVIDNDYIRQGAPRASGERPDRPMRSFPEGSEGIRRLHDVLRLCAERGIPVTLVGAPRREADVVGSTAFLQILDSRLHAIADRYPNVRVAWTAPTALPDALLGDSNSHLRPDLKSTYTRWLIGRLYGDEARSFVDFVEAEGKVPSQAAPTD
jgi:hypothetical protein